MLDCGILVLRQASGHIYMSKGSDHELTDSETVKTGKVPLEPKHCEQETTGLCFYGVEVQCACTVLHVAWTTVFLRSKVSPAVQSSGPVQRIVTPVHTGTTNGRGG